MTATKSSIPFFGQAYELVVGYSTPGDGTNSGTPVYETLTTDSWEPEALQITFEVQQATINSPWWYADISIYNLNTETINKIVLNAAWVTLKAGFQSGPTLSGMIWDGPVLQVLYDQVDVVDQRITLHCQANPLVENLGTVSFSMGRFSSQANLLTQAAAGINLPTIDQSNGTLSSHAQQLLSQKAYPRGNTVFGKYGDFMSRIADDQFLQTYRDGYKAYMTELGKPGSPPPVSDFTFSPSNPPDNNTPIPAGVTPTIIGTPRQTPQGVVFTVLLDPRLKVKIPAQVVSLIRTLPSQVSIQRTDSGDNGVSPLDSNLAFFVAQIRHIGDSRGNEWYTEITGYSVLYATNLLLGIFGTPSRLGG